MKLQSEVMQTSSSYDGGHCRSDGAAAVVCRSRGVEFRNESVLSRLPEEVLDEGEGLEVVDGHDGVEEPVVVGADDGHGLIREDLFRLSEMCSLGQFSKLGGAPLGGCDGVEVAALSRRRPSMHVILI